MRRPVPLLIALLALLLPSAAHAGWVPEPVVLGAAEDQAVDVGPDGTTAVAVRVEDRIQVRLRPPGGTFSAARPADPEGDASQRVPAVLATGDGRALVFWEGRPALQRREPRGLRVATVEADGTVGPDRLVDAAAAVNLPRARRLADGSVVVAWVEDSAVRVATRLAGGTAFAAASTALAVPAGEALDDVRIVPQPDGSYLLAVGSTDAAAIRLRTVLLRGATVVDGPVVAEERPTVGPGGAMFVPGGVALGGGRSLLLLNQRTAAAEPAPFGGTLTTVLDGARRIDGQDLGADDLPPALAPVADRPVLVGPGEADGRRVLLQRTGTGSGRFDGPAEVLADASVVDVLAGPLGGGRAGVLALTEDSRLLGTASDASGALAPLADVGPAAGLLGTMAGDGLGGVATAQGVQGLVLHVFDDEPPAVVATGPGPLTTGARGGLTAAVSDRWSAVPRVGWSFDDDWPALDGAAVERTFFRPGTVQATATATDAAGNVGRATVAVEVRAPDSTGGSGGGGIVTVPGPRPAVRDVRASRAGRRLTVRFTSSAAVRVRLVLERARPGVRRRGRCVAGRARTRAVRCTRWSRVGTSVTSSVRPGPGRLVVTRRLPSGRLRVRVVPVDATGRTGPAATAPVRGR